jgi:hypothetical protein
MSAAAIDYRSMIRPTVAFRLFNPSPVAVEGIHNGRFYRVPACDEHYVDRTVAPPQEYPEPGVLPISGYEYNETVGRVPERRIITAEDIVIHLTGEDGVSGQLGPRGIRLLYTVGDERNDAIKKEALEAYKTKTYEDAGATIAAFEAMNNKRVEFKQNPMPPTPKVREAYRYRAEVERGDTVQRADFSCPKCYEGITTETLLRDHITELHGQYASMLFKAAGLSAAPDQEDEEVPVAPVKRGPGRPRKVPAVQA